MVKGEEEDDIQPDMRSRDKIKNIKAEGKRSLYKKKNTFKLFSVDFFFPLGH